MLINYIKIALRSISRNKVTSTINILGFAAGFTAAVLIFLFVNDEFTFDTFHKDYDKIYGVILKNHEQSYANIPDAFSEKAVLAFPQFQYTTKILDKNTEVKLNQNVYEDQVTFAEPDFLKMFSYELIEGDINGFRSNPANIIITKSASQKYFAKESPIGKIISIKTDYKFDDFVVSALINDSPENSSLKPFIIIPYQNAESISMIKFSKADWGPADFKPYFFVKLKNTDDVKFINSKLSSMVPTEVIKRYGKMDYSLIPLNDIHFSNNINYSSIKTANIQTSYILCGIGILIISIISINFVNLSMGSFSQRFKEIGIRKIIGADRKKIFFQFIGESIITVIISFIISILLSSLILPSFNAVVEKNLNLGELLNHSNYLIITALLFLVGFTAGIYPAQFLSKVNTVNILKGEKKLSGSKLLSRVFIAQQFVIAIILLIGAVIINMQYNFIMKRDPGFKKENTIIVKTNEMFGRHLNTGELNAYKNELLQNTMIKSASLSDMVIGGNGRITGMSRFDYMDKWIFSYVFNIDQKGKEVIGLKLKQGKFFPDDLADSSNSIVVNESFIKALGLKNVLNEQVLLRSIETRPMTIIGVIKDFNYLSVKDEISPIAFKSIGRKNYSECIYVKYDAGNAQKVIKYLKSQWQKYFPDMSFEYSFLDEKIEDLYREENRWKDIINYSSVTAVIFACMGLFGLTVFSIEKRTKEIGIRKILGASAGSILKLVLSEFIGLVLIAIILAIPPSYYFGEKWLRNFAYRIEISWWVFVLAGGAALLISLLTVTFLVIKAAAANPVESLRYE